VKWGTLEDDNIGRWVVNWKNGCRVVRSNELDKSLEDIVEVREEIDQEVDTVGCNGI
jgi:hypothetical protein